MTLFLPIASVVGTPSCLWADTVAENSKVTMIKATRTKNSPFLFDLSILLVGQGNEEWKECEVWEKERWDKMMERNEERGRGGMRVVREEEEMGKPEFKLSCPLGHKKQTQTCSHRINYTYTKIYVLRHQFNSSKWLSTFFFHYRWALGPMRCHPHMSLSERTLKEKGTPHVVTQCLFLAFLLVSRSLSPRPHLPDWEVCLDAFLDVIPDLLSCFPLTECYWFFSSTPWFIPDILWHFYGVPCFFPGTPCFWFFLC